MKYNYEYLVLRLNFDLRGSVKVNFVWRYFSHLKVFKKINETSVSL